MLTRLATGTIQRYNWVAPQELKTEWKWQRYINERDARIKELNYRLYLEALEEEEDAYDPIYQAYKFVKKEMPKFKKIITVNENNQQVIKFKKINKKLKRGSPEWIQRCGGIDELKRIANFYQ